jgi:hypothetical protein
MARAEAMGRSDPAPPPARASSAGGAKASARNTPTPTIAAALAPRIDDGKLFEVRSIVSGQALFACQPIASGTQLFGEDDWADEAEKRSFSTLTSKQLDELAPPVRAAFLRFAYNVSPEQIRGTFRPEGVRHPVNFINHSCEPNAGYDGADHIVALRRIAAGEEIQMDYGTYSFSFDHDFTCTCRTWACRKKIGRNDWPDLVRSGLRLPGFMRTLADKALWG